jgi:DNA-binding HxlR family transcriptional regulator
VPECSVGDLLHLLGMGASGPILMELGNGRLRTKGLIERLPSFSPRTIYRYADKLNAFGLVGRREVSGVPSTVVYNLSDGTGRELFHLLNSYAKIAIPRGPRGQIEGAAWKSLGLVGEMWEWGWVDELSRSARSTTELAERTDGLTFHQVNRRLHLLSSRDLLRESSVRGRGKRYELSDEARRAMVLVAGLGRWQQRHLKDRSRTGLTVLQMSAVLRTILPLVRLPHQPGKSIKLGIVGSADTNGGKGSAVILARVGPDSSLNCSEDEDVTADGWAAGTIHTWCAAILDGRRGRMRVGGDLDLVNCSFIGLYDCLWKSA